MTKIEVYDSIRDGSQSPGLDLKAYQKLRIAEAIGRLATPDSPVYEELGWPNSNPEDREVYSSLQMFHLGNVIPTVFGSTTKVGVEASKDDSIKSLIGTKKQGVEIATIFGKSDLLHVQHVLGTSKENNLDIIKHSVKALRRAGMKVFYDAEHFFDGFKRDPDYALSTLGMAAESGAERLVLCDTNGGCLPFEIREIVQRVRNYLNENRINVPLGIHAHNDSGVAVANSLEAILEGASQVQGCIVPIGERTGNANLASLIALMHYRFGDGEGARLIAKHGLEIPTLNVMALKEVSDFVYTVTGIKSNPWEPFVGDYAPLHTGGVHQDAERKHKGLYSAYDLSEIGNTPRGVVLGLQSGTAHVATAVEQILGKTVEKGHSKIRAIYRQVTDMSAKGYQIGFLRAEQELLICQNFGWRPPFRIRHWDAATRDVDGHTISTAYLELDVDGQTIDKVSSVQDNGPVDAMYVALQEGLKAVRPETGAIEIIGFNVSLAREEGAKSPVRVYFEFGTPEMRWGCVGVGRNILAAAKESLEKGFNYPSLVESGMIQQY